MNKNGKHVKCFDAHETRVLQQIPISPFTGTKNFSVFNHQFYA
jgi:hypothetical protein